MAAFISKFFGKKEGFSLVEILLAAFIFSIFTVGTFTLAMDTIDRDSKVILEDEALRYAQEGLEAARNIRDQNYTNLVSGSYGLDFTADVWSFTAVPEDIDGFYSRTITVEDVYRDANGDIAEAGTLDFGTKFVSSTVDWVWRGVVPRSLTLNTYLTGWADEEWMQTTCTEFNAGTHSSTEAAISAEPPPDDCVLQLDVVEQQGTFFTSLDIGAHGNDVVVENNYVYLMTERTGEGLVIADISDTENPLIVDTVDLGGKGRNVTKVGNYLYIGVEKSSGGFAIVDVSNPLSASLVSTLNVGDYGNQSAVIGNTVLLGTEASSNALKVIDVTNKNSPALLTSVNLSAKVNSIVVSGNTAYAGVGSTTQGFKVLNVTTPTAPTVTSTLNVGYAVNSVEVYGAFAYLTTTSTSSSLRVVNVTNPASPSQIASLNVGGEGEDLAYQDGYVYVAVDVIDFGLVTVNAKNPVSPYIAYSVDVGGKGTGVDTDQGQVYVGIGVNNAGLMITDTVSTSVATSGNFVSAVLDTGSANTRYDYIEWESIEAVGGSIQYQIRTASSVAGLSSATWVGNDGTGASVYETSNEAIVLSPGATGSRYMQVLVLMTSDGVDSPAVESFSIHYRP